MNYDLDLIGTEKIREALEAPIVERPKLNLSKSKPVDECARWQMKPAPSHVKKKVPR
jgi:hypothetical protein